MQRNNMRKTFFSTPSAARLTLLWALFVAATLTPLHAQLGDTYGPAIRGAVRVSEYIAEQGRSGKTNRFC